MGVTNCTDVGPTLSSHEAASGDACARLLQPWDAGLADATLSASVGLAESVASRPDVSAESAPHGSAAERRGESTLHRLSTGALDSHSFFSNDHHVELWPLRTPRLMHQAPPPAKREARRSASSAASSTSANRPPLSGAPESSDETV